MFEKLQRLFKSDVAIFLIANVVFSISNFIVNLTLPYILPQDFYSEVVYVVQMVLYFTGIVHFGVILGLYKFYQNNKSGSLSVFYTFVLFINLFLLGLAVFDIGCLAQYLNIENIGYVARATFYGAAMFVGCYSFNRANNLVTRQGMFLVKNALIVTGLRVTALLLIYIARIESITCILLLLFYLPFVYDFFIFVKSSIQHVRVNIIFSNLFKNFVLFSLKTWIIGTLFMIADKMFLISTKDVDITFTTAVAFSAGLTGIINLFNTSFTNVFLSQLSDDRPAEIMNYNKCLNRRFLFYLFALVCMSSLMSLFVYTAYKSLGGVAAIVTFIALFRYGIISYMSYYTLLSKVLNLLSFEFILSALRLILMSYLCYCWQHDDMLTWYVVVVSVTMLPDILLVAYIKSRIRSLK